MSAAPIRSVQALRLAGCVTEQAPRSTTTNRDQARRGLARAATKCERVETSSQAAERRESARCQGHPAQGAKSECGIRSPSRHGQASTGELPHETALLRRGCSLVAGDEGGLRTFGRLRATHGSRDASPSALPAWPNEESPLSCCKHGHGHEHVYCIHSSLFRTTYGPVRAGNRAVMVIGTAGPRRPGSTQTHTSLF